MSRNLIDHMLDEMELASLISYQNWCSHVSSLYYTIPGLRTEYRKNIHSDRSKFKDYHRSLYWPVPNFGYANFEPFDFFRRNEKKINRHENCRYDNGDKYFKNRIYHDRGYLKSHLRHDRSSFSSDHCHADRPFPSTLSRDEALQRYKQMQQEDYYNRIASRYSGKYTKADIRNYQPPLMQNKDIMYNMRRSASPVNSIRAEECITHEQSSSGIWSSESIESDVNIIEEEGKSLTNKSSNSLISLINDIGLSQKLKNDFVPFTSWYCTAEQEQIIETLREVNMRHDRQIRRDILACQSEVQRSEEQCASNTDSLSKQTSPCSSTSDEEDRITLVLSPDKTSQIPDIVNDKEASGYDSDYLEKSATDYFEEFQSIFTVSPEKKIINALTKENLKMKLQEKDKSLERKEDGSTEGFIGDCKGMLEFEENKLVMKNRIVKDDGDEANFKADIVVPESPTVNLFPDVNYLNTLNIPEKVEESFITYENDCDVQNQSDVDVGNILLNNELICPKTNNGISFARNKEVDINPNISETEKQMNLNASSQKIHKYDEIHRTSSPSFQNGKKQNEVKSVKKSTNVMSNFTRKLQEENAVEGLRKHPFNLARKQKSYPPVYCQRILKAVGISDLETFMNYEVAENSMKGNRKNISTEAPFELINNLLHGRSINSDTCLLSEQHKNNYVQSDRFNSFSDPHLQQGTGIRNYKRISVSEIFKPQENFEETRHLKQLLNIQNANDTVKLQGEINMSYTEHLKHILGIEKKSSCSNAKCEITSSNKCDTSAICIHEKQPSLENNMQSSPSDSSTYFKDPSCKAHLPLKNFSKDAQNCQTPGLAVQNSSNICSANDKLVTACEFKNKKPTKSLFSSSDCTSYQCTANESNLEVKETNEVLCNGQNVHKSSSVKKLSTSMVNTPNTYESKKRPHAENTCHCERDKIQKKSKQKKEKEKENNPKVSSIKMLPNYERDMEKCVRKEFPRNKESHLHNTSSDDKTPTKSDVTTKYPSSCEKNVHERITDYRSHDWSKNCHFNRRNFNNAYSKERHTQRHKLIKPFSKLNLKEKLSETPIGEKGENISTATKLNFVQNVDKNIKQDIESAKQSEKCSEKLCSFKITKQVYNETVMSFKTTYNKEKTVFNKSFQNNFQNQRVNSQNFINSKTCKRRFIGGKFIGSTQRTEKSCVCNIGKRNVENTELLYVKKEESKHKNEILRNETNSSENSNQTVRNTSEKKFSSEEDSKNSCAGIPSNVVRCTDSLTRENLSGKQDNGSLDKNLFFDEPDKSSSIKSLLAESVKISLTEEYLPAESAKIFLTEKVLPTESVKISSTEKSLTEESAKISLSEESLPAESAKIFLTENSLPTESAKMYLTKKLLPSQSSKSVTEKYLPVEPIKISLTEESFPAESAKIFLTEKLLPTEFVKIPLTEKSMPVESTKISLTEESLPTESTKMSLTEKLLPAQSSKLSVTEKSLPVEPIKISLTEESLPAESAKIFWTEKLLPTEFVKIPLTEKSMPVEPIKISLTEESLPAESAKIFWTEKLLPTEFVKIPLTEKSMPAESTKIYLTEESLPAESAKIFLTENLLPTEFVKISLTEKSLPVESSNSLLVESTKISLTEESLSAEPVKVSWTKKSKPAKSAKTYLIEKSVTAENNEKYLPEEHSKSSLNQSSLVKGCNENDLRNTPKTENYDESLRNGNSLTEESFETEDTTDINKVKIKSKIGIGENSAAYDQEITTYASISTRINSILIRAQNMVSNLKGHDLLSNNVNKETLYDVNPIHFDEKQSRQIYQMNHTKQELRNVLRGQSTAKETSL